MADETKYIYEVHPRKAMNIPGVGTIRTNKSVPLTKKEVISIFGQAHIWRRFSNPIRSERVTRDSIDRLHNDTYIPEEEWGFKSKASEEIPSKKDEKKEESHPTVDEKPMTEAKSISNTLIHRAEEEKEVPVPEEIEQTEENETETVDTVDNTDVEGVATPVGVIPPVEDTVDDTVEDNEVEADEITATAEEDVPLNETEQENESGETDAVVQNDEEIDTEESTDNKEDESSEASIRDQENTNQYDRKKNYGNKKHRR